ncbi:TolB-like translocation protein, partial [Salinivibrio sharmensis]
NDFDEKNHNYVARVFSIKENKEVTCFDKPVQDSCKTDYFISLNYQRLMTLRPDYGYRNLPTLNDDELNECEKDGLWRVDFETGKSELLISIADARNVKPRDEFDAAVHKFNHVMISPDGNRLIFMHRYLIGKRRFDRLLLADAKTGAMKLLSDFGMVSHCFWADDNTVLGYMRGPEEKDGYWLLDVDTGEFTPFAHEVLSKYGDGHPHVVGDWFITDTYPDKARMQHLLQCNWKTGEVKHVGEFFHCFQFSGETRCDLHPRLTPDGKAVYFDSVFTGERKLYRMELP